MTIDLSIHCLQDDLDCEAIAVPNLCAVGLREHCIDIVNIKRVSTRAGRFSCSRDSKVFKDFRVELSSMASSHERN